MSQGLISIQNWSDSRQIMKLEVSGQNGHLSFFSRLQHKLEGFWYRSQIGHRSEYSVERLLSLRDYCLRTSVARVVVICFLAPVPALLTALAIDCIPLKPPSEGWKTNYTLWIRLFLAMLIEAMGVLFQVRAVINPGTISSSGGVKIAITTAGLSVLTMVIFAVLWEFPTPFGYVLVIGPYVLYFSISTVLVVGRQTLIQSPTLRQQFKSQFIIVASQGLVGMCYPAFSAVFNRLSGTQQTLLIFVMPMIKFFTKQNIANAAKSYHEYVGPVVVFSVDLFNVFYVAICMQASKSAMTTLVIMISDTFHVILALRDMFPRKTSRVIPNRQIETQLTHYLEDLPKLLEQKFHDGRSLDRIRVFAPFPLPLSNSSRKCMSEMTATRRLTQGEITRCSKESTKQTSGPSLKDFPMPTLPEAKQNQIVPAIVVETKISSSDNLDKDSRNITKFVVHDGLQILFHSEYILLAEYIEFMVPMLYALYLSVLYHLPVAAFYPHSASMTSQKLRSTVTNVLVYGMIEFAAFGVLLVLLKRKLGFLPLYQLAFVLETQAPALQGHLFVWTITILHLTLNRSSFGVWYPIAFFLDGRWKGSSKYARGSGVR
ncbi:hypothetical protein P3T76_007379 [Phytophthora citrophthora]|uniref:Transmembrane protein n=1 Tax=Phytophthora citrophthora TaxID=4793 RepID=A0AAD9LLQ2_9STRA|nr:hypothetical protein P3T76_007379 [Phytophthora citrophthora]